MTNKPIHEFRVGRITAAIWKNESQYGAHLSVTFSKLYRSTESGSVTWKRTESFAHDDLPTLEKVCDLAFHWMNAHPPEDHSKKSEKAA